MHDVDDVFEKISKLRHHLVLNINVNLWIYLTVILPSFDPRYYVYLTRKIGHWAPFYVEAKLLQGRNYLWYIPDNESKMVILGWNLSRPDGYITELIKWYTYSWLKNKY